jgi:hypothetical protein
LDNLKIELDKEMKGAGGEEEESTGQLSLRDLKPLQGGAPSEHSTVQNQIQLFLDRLKLKHFEDMESVESLIRSTATHVDMSQPDFLAALRHVYHTNLLSL